MSYAVVVCRSSPGEWREEIMPTVAEVVAYLEKVAPPTLAAGWDNVGLLLGRRDAAVKRLMTCLTVTPESAAEAVAEGAQLVVSHHPILFRGAKRLNDSTPEGRMILDLAGGGVAVYSPHTAFDNTAGGINDLIASRLNLTDVGPLRPLPGPAHFKVVVFVPDKDLDRVCDALFAAGAGYIGQYSECSFRLAGTGTFFGSEATNPSIGQKGRREAVSEWRLEAVCPEGRLEQAITAMRRAHSYEEPAYDVYPLRVESGGRGEGRVGTLAQRLILDEFARAVKQTLGGGAVQVVGEPNKVIRRAAIVCGAGGDFVADAARAGAEVLLTGEARFHDCLEARARGVALVLSGHYATERCGVEDLARRLGEQWPDVQSWASRRETDPGLWV
jgi:dinuclear metal center YbgI/SA1388 family protein